MITKRIYKCNIIARDQDRVQEFLSHPLFSKKIINPYANVGVIESENLVLQVQVISPESYGASLLTRINTNSENMLELEDHTISYLYTHLQKLEHEIAV